MNNDSGHREIPFNYTSADDRQAVTWLLGAATWDRLEELRARRVTGRSARVLMRFLGDLLVHRRNAYLYEALVTSAARRRQLFARLAGHLEIVTAQAGGNATVLAVVAEGQRLLAAWRQELAEAPRQRRRLRATLGPIVGGGNVRFDPFTIVSHATDATDWRLFLPVAVVLPTAEEQVAPLLAAIGRLGLHVIPRGAGTGLTGGAVPLRADCVIINTERLNKIRGLRDAQFPGKNGGSETAPVLELEAGVITEAAMEYAAARGLVFATDPTSAWASTIGGNIAENAGGKTAVLWGTCLDNLLDYQMAMPGGRRFTVHRPDHPRRKIAPTDTVTWEVRDEGGALCRTVTLAAAEIRKPGLWKDITNKALNGLPGVQKEGTDGVITSATFILHPQYPARSTLCLEFFGPDMDEASRVILELCRAFPNEGHEVLQALEHFDGEYVRAIGYKTKAARPEPPRAVLLVDVVGQAVAEVERGVARVRDILARHANTALTVARDRAEAELFWADRKKLGAIAAHTNAFKLNEDVVLPLTALAEFARFCDALNLEEERYIQGVFIARAEASLEDASPGEDAPWLAAKMPAVQELCEHARDALDGADEAQLRSRAVIHELQAGLGQLLRGYDQLAAGLEAIHTAVRQRRIVIATHMHAGDGNVHVNIPVLSNDRAMMRRAEAVVDQVMQKVTELGGVCSGEHGIGVTKLKYLEERFVHDLAAYRRAVDPDGVMNPGKLVDRAVLDQLYTPSFNLLELEARILQHGQLETLAQQIATCVRCGKCKPNCCVFHPARGLFYHPRNKNLAIGALIEALLYETQRDRAARFDMLRHLAAVADHCTICHKCLKPCPVDIDTGVVSILERGILRAHGCQQTKPATAATLRYLESRSPAFNGLFRAGVVRAGGAVQRTLARAARRLPAGEAAAPYPLQMLRSAVPAGDTLTLRDVLPPCAAHEVLLFEPDDTARGTVFYFPGCGSERLYGSVAMAALSVLLASATRVVLPPPWLCCGFPHQVNARADSHGRIVLRDTIVFSQIRAMLAHLEFDAVAVTCGTCREALGQFEAGRIFGAPVLDVAAWAASRGLTAKLAAEYLYHAPCHDSLDGRAAAVLGQLGGCRLAPVPHCCSEAGTLALSRPDITDAMLHRKTAALAEAAAARPACRVVLTNCPSCLQGLGRPAHLGLTPRHVVVELARRLGGERWLDDFRARAARATAVPF